MLTDIMVTCTLFLYNYNKVGKRFNTYPKND